jgi:formate hydrogenlyase transcriptional activator
LNVPETTIQSTDWQRRQYRTLLDLSKAIATHRKLPDLLYELAGHLRDLVDFRSLGVWLHDGSRHVMRMHTLETSEPAVRQLPSEIPVEGSIAGWVWQHQQPFVTPDVQQETRFPTTQLVHDVPMKSACVLPLTTAHQRLGVLHFASDRTGAYDQLDLEFAQLVAAEIAVAVESALAFQEAESYRRQLAHERDRSRLLLEINNMLVSTLNLRELLSAISACLKRAIPHDGAGLALYDPASNMLRFSALEFPGHEDVMTEGELYPLEGSPAGLALTTRRVVLSDARDMENLPPALKGLSAAGVKSGCSIPLTSRGRGLGVLCIVRLCDDAFTDDDVDVLTQIANQVAIAVENALSFREIDALKNKLAEEKLYLEEELRTEHNFEEIIGKSLALKRVLQQVEMVAQTGSTVLLVGETGTGKELLARAIHNLSPRREHTFVKVNCAAIPTGLLESELFGHEKGAFTGAIERRLGRFELAHQGTIFLDEVGDVPLELQPKLLRVLQEREFERLGSSRTVRVDTRVVAATNGDLARMVADKQFRSDLYYRLNVFPITVPPLRERPEDIPLLVHFFAHKLAKQMKKPIERIPTPAMAALTAYPWPGNIRELQNLIERAMILSRGPVLEVPLAELKQSADTATAQPDAATLKAIEREHILRVLRASNWVIGGATGASARLGLPRTTLNNKLRKLGISRPYA